MPLLYSTTCAYAIRALCRLAVIAGDRYVQVGDICEGTDLPAPFIAKVLRELVEAKLLISAKGRGGGYALAKSAEKIRLIDVVEAIDGKEHVSRCVVGLAACNDKQPCPQHEDFKPVRAQIGDYLRETTLQTMAGALEAKLDLLGKSVHEPERGRPMAKRA
ncbi:MAG: Rrf2 family transcriptional regulator [Planctomycetota bacterium]